MLLKYDNKQLIDILTAKLTVLEKSLKESDEKHSKDIVHFESLPRWYKFWNQHPCNAISGYAFGWCRKCISSGEIMDNIRFLQKSITLINANVDNATTVNTEERLAKWLT